METKPMTVEHNGVEITYSEDKNKWVFELRGRQRSADSLADAKLAIDAPPPKDRIPFDRTEVWVQDHWSKRWQLWEATSLTQGRHEDSVMAVTVRKDSNGRNVERSNRYLPDLYPNNAINKDKIDQIIELQAKLDEISKQMVAIKKTMKCLDAKDYA